MELLLNLPIWLILLLGMIDVGEMLSNVQQVTMAARVGAEEASRTASLDSAQAVPERIVDAVERQLAAAGLSAGKVVLEHNAGNTPATLVWGDGPGDPPQASLPAYGPSVRVTVAARMRGLLPVVLRSLGLDFSSQMLVQSTTFRYNVQPTESE